MSSDRTAHHVFGLLSDETRLDVLRAVAEAQTEQRSTGITALSFSDIYDRVEVDNTSKLSYHLGELTGTFLRKHEDGYAFTHAGEQLVRFVLAENYRQPPDFGTVEVDGTCLRCGETGLSAVLHDQYFLLRCRACERPSFSYKVRPALVRAHDGADLVDALASELAADLLKMRRGVCPDCAGSLETEVVETDEERMSESIPVSFATGTECQQCMRFLSLPLTHAAAYHPESIAFHWERGVDLLATGTWEFHRFLHGGRWTAERVDTDPEEYRVELRRDDAVLRLFLDETAAVTRTERVQRRDQRDTRA